MTIEHQTPPRRRARACVDLAAIATNWRRIAKAAGSAETAGVVKADAYGCGAEAAARALGAAGCRTFFTATLGEALQVRAALPDASIYVLNGPRKEDVADFLSARIAPVLNSLSQIGLWTGAGAPFPAALHIDTGMNRLGLPLDQIGLAAAALHGELLAFVMSHLACASEPAHPHNEMQARRFHDASLSFQHARRSLASTAGIFGRPDLAYDLVRPGLGLYGHNALDEGGPALAPAMSVLAPVLQTRTIEAGETVGYGATFTAMRKTRLATIALGYADGYLRAASSRGYGVLNGVRCPIAGRVSMDLITLDITDAGPVEDGAWVEMLGPHVPLMEIAEAMATAPYEVLTNLGARLERTYTGGA
jgi:alanine racemase